NGADAAQELRVYRPAELVGGLNRTLGEKAPLVVVDFHEQTADLVHRTAPLACSEDGPSDRGAARLLTGDGGLEHVELATHLLAHRCHARLLDGVDGGQPAQRLELGQDA